MQKKVLMILSNPCNPDPRVIMEANLLTEIGHIVDIICWDREDSIKNKEFEVINQINIKRLKYKSTYGTGLKQLNSMFKFWKTVYKEIKINKYDIIHCHDFDTLIPGFLGAKKSGSKIIFDAHEIYAEMIEFHTPKILVKIIHSIEKFIVKRVNAVITVGERMKDYYKIYNNNTIIVGNYKNAINSGLVKEFKIKTRQVLDIPKDAIVITYVGVFAKDRALLPLINSIKNANENVFLIIGGKGENQNEIEKLIGNSNNIKYLGFINNEKISEIISAADFLYYGLYKEFQNNYYSTPNSLFNAISVGIPTITTNIGEIAEIVSKKKLGYVLDEDIEDGLSSIIEEIKFNGENIYEMKINTTKVQQEYSLDGNKKNLRDIYNAL
ncbi:glycosyltransferase family 4 protein [Bacillus sp. Cr_A10]|uniref:glycosyltransferase family 4 protein n=1 Tax=Bacillus sp. Cr_A10 TaxID=3033993 RepID=UPI0023DC80A6|nr:glycosyltransferase family 4 protein [Bacillus sp. Cr_A10]MDF2068166.1 glycosyltransferase family 4 protein [Bacillus sp. Cr_A10]